jgi:hypothetical protein
MKTGRDLRSDIGTGPKPAPSRRWVAVVCSAALAVSTSMILFIQTAPNVAAQTAPPYFLSNYVTSLNYSNWDSYGCQQVHYSTGEGVSQISLILDFGTPWDTGGEYGTVLPQSGIFAQWDSGGQSGIPDRQLPSRLLELPHV